MWGIELPKAGADEEFQQPTKAGAEVPFGEQSSDDMTLTAAMIELKKPRQNRMATNTR